MVRMQRKCLLLLAPDVEDDRSCEELVSDDDEGRHGRPLALGLALTLHGPQLEHGVHRGLVTVQVQARGSHQSRKKIKSKIKFLEIFN